MRQHTKMKRNTLTFAVGLIGLATSSLAGPPYQTDDPVPTDYKHYETYVFNQGSSGKDGWSGAYGLDFNYGAAPDLQLTAVLPFEQDFPKHGSQQHGIGNIELAAKFRIAHQEISGWDVAVFPRLFVSSPTRNLGNAYTSFLLPIWIGKRFKDGVGMFGGGGCVYNPGTGNRNFCTAGWVVTKQVLPRLQIGAELVHQTPDAVGGKPSTNLGLGLTYDLNDHYHLLANIGPGLENLGQNPRYSCYTSLQITN